MEKSDWLAIIEHAPIEPLMGALWRVVESQEQIATMALVQSLQEQAVLEDLLENSKPPYRRLGDDGHRAQHSNHDDAGELSYLLATPFRYPPLPWGSRFGSRFEPSVYYGSIAIETALAESAYYRLVFWQGMTIAPPSGRLITQHTVFRAQFRCRRGVELQSPPFDAHQCVLTDRKNYQSTQTLGAALRDIGVQGFRFVSARCPQQGLNVALFVSQALASQRSDDVQSWLCETRASDVSFRSADDSVSFEAEMLGA